MSDWTDFRRKVPLVISRSHETTRANRTGTWRFVRPFQDEKTAPCSASCPVGEDIARIEYLLASGRAEEAWQLVLLENPLPAVSGRVCYHPCETVCNRALFDSGIAIHELERAVGDRGLEAGWPLSMPPRPASGKTVAIVGGGPAGLSAGWFLNMLGYRCEVMEKEDEAGGLLRWGIPAYRLPEDVLQSEIRRIEKSGVRLTTGQPVTPEAIEGLERRFDAVFVSIGNNLPYTLKVAGDELAQDGLAFLRNIRRGAPLQAPMKSAVIGGGNTAIDVARSLLRLGGQPVIVYRRRREDMPAAREELEAALAEGVEIIEMAAPEKITSQDGDILLGLRAMRPDGRTKSGRTRVVPGMRRWTMTFQSVFTAIGAGVEQAWSRSAADNASKLDLGHTCLYQTGRVPVIYGGDLTNGEQTVTHALASGKQAAIALDIFFSQGVAEISPSMAKCRVGDGPALSMERYLGMDRAARNSHLVRYEELNLDYFQMEAAQAEDLPAAGPAPLLDFNETAATLGKDEAAAEALRCFNCGICNQCDNCRLYCPELAVSPGPQRRINLQYCKGCGICAVECPRNALSLEEE